MHTQAAPLLSLCVTGCAVAPAPQPATAAREQVMATERAFAKTMADRDHAAFTSFLSTDAVFFSGPVHDASGNLVATFTSIWRREAPDTWRIVFDKGNDVCSCAKP